MDKLFKARAIIVDNDRVLIMKRRRDGQDYYTLIGGGVDMGETPEQACVREVLEEATLEIELVREIIRLEDFYKGKYYVHVIFLCRYKGGTPTLGGEEKTEQTSENIHEPVWVNKSDIPSLNFKRDCIDEAFKNKTIDLDKCV